MFMRFTLRMIIWNVGGMIFLDSGPRLMVLGTKIWLASARGMALLHYRMVCIIRSSRIR